MAALSFGCDLVERLKTVVAGFFFRSGGLADPKLSIDISEAIMSFCIFYFVFNRLRTRVIGLSQRSEKCLC
jgi:hypothetical protein